MTIALFSDVHANLPAFKAFLLHLEQQQTDAVYCLGDLVGYHIWPNEVIDEVRRRRIPVLAGNHDARVAKLSAGGTTAATGKNYAYHLIGAAQRSYLATLPAHIRLDFQLNGASLSVLMVHGSPSSNEEYLLEDKAESEFLTIFKDAGADILCFGHSHKPYYRAITLEGKIFHAVNTGSVGKPKDGSPDGSYVLLHITPSAGGPVVNAEIVRFAYDVEAAARAIEESPLPAEFADRLRKAY